MGGRTGSLLCWLDRMISEAEDEGGERAYSDVSMIPYVPH